MSVNNRKGPVKYAIVGGDELQKALEELGSEVAGQKGGLVKNALFAAGRVVKARMVENAPESEKGSWIGTGNNRHRGQPGRLKRSIQMFREKNPRKLSEITYVGPMAGKTRDDPKGAWYAAIVEFQGGKGGKGEGYMRRSINPEEDTKTIRVNLAKGIERVAIKIGNANARAVGAKIKKL